MKKENTATRFNELTEAQKKMLEALSGNPDTTEDPEAPAENWQHAKRGKFHKQRKESITIRLDADVLEWVRNRSDKYQSEINRLLRETMEADVAHG